MTAENDAAKTESAGRKQPITVAVVDDDPSMAKTIALQLRVQGFTTDIYRHPVQFLKEFQHRMHDLVILDLRMPEMDGISVLQRIKEQVPETEVIIVSGDTDKQDAIRALKLGAYDFFEKPVDPEELAQTMRRTVRYREAMRERDHFAEQVSYLSQREAEKWGIGALVGQSDAFQAIIADVRKMQALANTSVLITGESGTGKEVAARAIHFGSARLRRPFVPINCAAISPELAESTLFGHTAGAFTGAVRKRKGCFDMADGGTLFLDEIGDMPLALQGKLLRILEDGMVTPVGSERSHFVDVRVLAATNVPIADLVKQGGFREDLFYRLAAFMVHMPALRERPEDIAPLAEHFARRLSSEMGFPEPRFTSTALSALAQHAYPGNARELRNVVERALIDSSGQIIELRHIHFGPASPVTPAAGSPVSDAGALQELPLMTYAQAQASAVRRALSAARGNISEAARLLGINRTKLYRLISILPD